MPPDKADISLTFHFPEMGKDRTHCRSRRLLLWWLDHFTHLLDHGVWCADNVRHDLLNLRTAQRTDLQLPLFGIPDELLVLHDLRQGIRMSIETPGWYLGRRHDSVTNRNRIDLAELEQAREALAALRLLAVPLVQLGDLQRQGLPEIGHLVDGPDLDFARTRHRIGTALHPLHRLGEVLYFP